MKTLFLGTLLLLSQVALFGADRGFIQVGSLYSFVFAGKDPLIARVEANEGGGWFKVSTLQNMPRRDELWVNLGQVQTISLVGENEDAFRFQKQQEFIRGNLEAIAAAIRDYRGQYRRGPDSMDDLARVGFKIPRPIAGEDYNAIDVRGGGPISVVMSNGTEVSVPRR
jgi:hypothetical protein